MKDKKHVVDNDLKLPFVALASYQKREGRNEVGDYTVHCAFPDGYIARTSVLRGA